MKETNIREAKIGRNELPIFQGDVFFEWTASIPSDAEEVPPEEGRLLVAHSETGHHHTVGADRASMFLRKSEPHLAYLRLSNEFADVTHHREYDTHDTLRLMGGAGDCVKITRQRESTPEGWVRQVVD